MWHTVLLQFCHMLRFPFGDGHRVVPGFDPSYDMVLSHLTVNSHSRPVECLSGFAHIPVCGKERGKQAVSLLPGKTFNIFEMPADLLGQVDKGYSPGGKIDEDGL